MSSVVTDAGLGYIVARQRYYAVFSDGREQLVSITVLNGEPMCEALERMAREIGAIKIVLKPEEAPAVIV